MQGKMRITCEQCGQIVAIIRFDTDDSKNARIEREDYIYESMFRHRDFCAYCANKLTTWSRFRTFFESLGLLRKTRKPQENCDRQSRLLI